MKVEQSGRGHRQDRGGREDTLNKDEENLADPDDRHLITLAEEDPINNGWLTKVDVSYGWNFKQAGFCFVCPLQH